MGNRTMWRGWLSLLGLALGLRLLVPPGGAAAAGRGPLSPPRAGLERPWLAENFPVPGEPGPRPSVECRVTPAPTPSLTLQKRRPWSRRLPARIASLSLWGTALALAGPALITPALAKAAIGIGLGGLIGGPLVHRLRSRLHRRLRSDAATAEADGSDGGAHPGHRRLADRFGLLGTELFRARHARGCTPHQDETGRIVAINWPDAQRPFARTDRDAHPVG